MSTAVVAFLIFHSICAVGVAAWALRLIQKREVLGRHVIAAAVFVFYHWTIPFWLPLLEADTGADHDQKG